jgi:hypothetical protein
MLVAATLNVVLLPHVVAFDKKNKAQEHIEVVAHLRLEGGPILRFTITRHANRSYLYVEYASHALALLDVTDALHPKRMGMAAAGSIVAAAGDAALISSETADPPTVREKSLTIVSFADPAHPRTIRQFNKVTCTAVDDTRALVFLANDEGLWILHHGLADDAALQDRYAHDVLYNH